MEQSKLVKVTGVTEPKSDKNGIPYKSIEVSTPEKKRVKDALTGNVEVVTAKVKTGVFNVFAHNYLELSALATKNKVEIKDLKKKEIEDIKSDFGYDLQPGDKLEGWIVTRRVVPYSIVDTDNGEERIVDYYTCPVLGDTEDPGFEQAIKQTFARNRDRDNNPYRIIEDRLDMAPITVTANEAFSEQPQEQEEPV